MLVNPHKRWTRCLLTALSAMLLTKPVYAQSSHCLAANSITADFVVTHDEFVKVLGRQLFPDSTAMTMKVPGTANYLVAFSWRAPDAGALFLVSCQGKPLTSFETPFVDSLTIIELPAVGKSVFGVWGTSAGATGYRSSGIVVVEVRDSQIRALWEGYTLIENFPLSGLGRRDQTAISIHKNGTITQRTVRHQLALDSLPERWVELPDSIVFSKHFVWDDRLRRFRLVRTPRR